MLWGFIWFYWVLPSFYLFFFTLICLNQLRVIGFTVFLIGSISFFFNVMKFYFDLFGVLYGFTGFYRVFICFLFNVIVSFALIRCFFLFYWVFYWV